MKLFTGTAEAVKTVVSKDRFKLHLSIYPYIHRYIIVYYLILSLLLHLHLCVYPVRYFCLFVYLYTGIHGYICICIYYIICVYLCVCVK